MKKISGTSFGSHLDLKTKLTRYVCSNTQREKEKENNSPNQDKCLPINPDSEGL